MKRENETLEAKLREIDPLGEGEPGQGDRGPKAEELLAAILASDPGPQPRPRRARSRSGRRILVPVALAAMAILAVAVGLPGGGGDRAGLPALERAAAAAAAERPPLDLPYLYAKTRGAFVNTAVAGGQSWSTYNSEVTEEWIAEDGSGRRRRVQAPPRFVGPSDREAWEAAGRPNFLAHGFEGSAEAHSAPPGTFDDRLAYGGDPLAEIPTDPTELSQWLRDRVTDPKTGAGAGNGFPLSVKTLSLVAEILRNPLASPGLRAALYEAEAQMPGIEYLGPASDEIGRHGVAVGARSANSGAPTLYSLIFDPKTSQVLATEQTQLRPPPALPEQKAPLVISSEVFVRSGTTDSLRARP